MRGARTQQRRVRERGEVIKGHEERREEPGGKPLPAEEAAAGEPRSTKETLAEKNLLPLNVNSSFITNQSLQIPF